MEPHRCGEDSGFYYDVIKAMGCPEEGNAWAEILRLKKGGLLSFSL